MKLIWSFILLIVVNHAFSQAASRKILDKQTNIPVSYATVKILHVPKGVIASINGEFKLDIDPADSVLFSCVGYQQKILVGKEIGTEIYLVPKIKLIDEITVKTKKWIRTVVLGNTDKKLKGDENWGLTKEGKDEFAQKIELPDSLLFYKINKIYIPVKKYLCWGPLLLHIYAKDSVSEYPGEELLIKPIFIEKKDIRQNKLIIDISAENFFLNDCKSFFVGISPLQDSVSEKCLTTLLVSKSSNERSYKRTLYHSSYQWFTFGLMKDQNNIIYEVRTFFSVEADEMR